MFCSLQWVYVENLIEIMTSVFEHHHREIELLATEDVLAGLVLKQSAAIADDHSVSLKVVKTEHI